MIEINLLPEDLRKADHTPPARLGAIAMGVLVLCAMGFTIGFYKFVKIPQMTNEIATDKVEIKSLEIQKAEKDAVEAKMADLKKKVTTLSNLIANRLIYARLMDTLTNVVNQVEGSWFRSFSVTPDSNSPQGGRRFQLALTGYTTGNSDLERDQKLREVISSLTYWFRLRPDVIDKDTGFNKFIGATFELPVLLSKSTVASMPAPLGISDPAQLKVINSPKEGLDFSLTISFALQPPKQQPQ